MWIGLFRALYSCIRAFLCYLEPAKESGSKGKDESAEPFEATTSPELSQFRQGSPCLVILWLASTNVRAKLQRVDRSRRDLPSGCELALPLRVLGSSLVPAERLGQVTTFEH
jgi:hypothetical protein